MGNDFDPTTLLCDGCIANLEAWLAAGTEDGEEPLPAAEFLGAFLVWRSFEPQFEKFFCPRCTAKLYGWMVREWRDDAHQE